tara:strand:+ start:135 stop:809 length:675 start_codon:yes stop_codon:yes gene_type:complete
MMDRFTNSVTNEVLEVETLGLFATPTIVTPFPKHKNYKWESFERVDRKPEQWFTPLNTSFPDIEDDDPYVDKETSDKLKGDILGHLQKVFQCYNMPHEIRYSAFWYNAYYEGDAQEPHDHLAPDNHNPYWCGIYFAKNCFDGQLVFQQKNPALRLQQTFDYPNSKLAEYYNDAWVSAMQDGMIFLFPPHLTHGIKVGAENRNKMRLTFSFNLAIDGILLQSNVR